MFFKFACLNAVLNTLTEFELHNGKIKLKSDIPLCLTLDYFRFLNIYFILIIFVFVFSWYASYVLKHLASLYFL